MATKLLDLSHQRQQTRFRGFTSPRYTPVPDALFDELMSLLTGAELKVVLYIIRRTFGFKKESEAISLSQIRRGITTRDGRVLDRGTGLSLSAAQTAIKGLVEKGIVVATRNRSAHKGDEATTYRLHMREPDRSEGRAQMDEQSTNLRQDTDGGAGTKPDDASATVRFIPVTENQQGGGVPAIGEGGYRKSATQETVSQQTAIAFRISKAAQEERRDGDRQEPGDAGDGKQSQGRAQTRAIAEEPQMYVPVDAHAAPQPPIRSGSLRSLADVLAGRQIAGETLVPPAFPVSDTGVPPTPPSQPSQATALTAGPVARTAPHAASDEDTGQAHRQPTPQVIAVITEISQQFGDHHHLRSNFTQAMRVWEASSRSETAFVGTLYEARSITRQQPRVSRRMPYFWSVVRDLLGLRPQELPPAIVAAR